MIDPIKKAIFGYADLGKKEDRLGVKAIDQYNQLLDVAASRLKLLRRANVWIDELMKQLEGVDMPIALSDFLDELAKELGDD